MYSVVCAHCETGFKFKRRADPGELIWLQCPECAGILMARLPGKRNGPKVRASSQKKRAAIYEVFSDAKPRLTVRQVFYALAVRGVVPKSGAGYRQAQYQLKVLRRAGILPYGWIADNTRWVTKPTTYAGLAAALEAWHVAYRRDLWANRDVHVEVWVEKDAIAGVINPVTREYDVGLHVARGFSSMTFAHDAAEQISELDKDTYIYHFGDFDPSGVNAAEVLNDELALHGARAHFERMAVLGDQVRTLDLPTLTVNRRDPRAKTWAHPYVCELEALPANVLRSMVQDCIERHVDAHELREARRAERLERATLETVLKNFVQVQNNGGEPIEVAGIIWK